MTNAASTNTINFVPVQGVFGPEPTFTLVNLIGPAGTPFYPNIDPSQSGLSITNSTINSSVIGGISPSSGTFTNIATTTGTISSTPTGSLDLVNKSYVDNIAQGLIVKAPCLVATTADITLSTLQTIDGVTVAAGDRVLVKNQGTASQNGIYVAATGAWTRATDMDVWAEVPSSFTFIESGTTQADTGWVCTSNAGGTINVTPINFVQFSAAGAYTAGTGLTLAGNTFSITNTGVTANSYGSAFQVGTFTVNAQGQLTNAASVSIAIANTQVSGLGTMSTQNANNVSITGGSITGTPISGSTVGGSTITASTQFDGPGTGLTGTASGLSIGGSAASATTAGSVTNSVTFNDAGAGGVTGSTFNGASALTVSYNTIGAPSTTGTGASGTWAISISGNAATVTNGLYSNGSYSNPTWLTSISGSIVSGAVASATDATNATNATNLSGGATYSFVYQSAAGVTAYLAAGTAGYVLTTNGGSLPTWTNPATLVVSSATTATNLAGGIASQIPYQSGAGTTAFVANGTTGQVLTSNGTGAPTWSTPVSAVTVTDDTTTNATRYPLYADVTSGTLSTEYVASTKYQFNPSTGILTATGFSGSGANLTSIPNGALVNSSVTIGSTAVALGATVTTFAGLTSVTSTTFVGDLSGNATTATTATTATNATNIAITDNTTSVSTYYPVISSATTGNTGATTSSTKFSFVPNTGVLTATSFSGAGTGLTGTASSLSIGGNAANVTGIVAVANGGTGTASPGLIAGTNVTITGTWPNQTINSSGGGGGSLTVSNDTTTATDLYPLFATTTSGTLTAVNTSNAKLLYKPSTGELEAPELIANNGIILNNTTVTTSYTIAAGTNGFSVGPLTLNSGVTITVSSGQRHVII